MATTLRRQVPKTAVVLRIVHSATVASGDPTREGCETAAGGQNDMTVLAVHEHRAGDAETPAVDRELTFTALNARKGSGQFFIGWVPGRGNDRDATATDAVEW